MNALFICIWLQIFLDAMFVIWLRFLSLEVDNLSTVTAAITTKMDSRPAPVAVVPKDNFIAIVPYPDPPSQGKFKNICKGSTWPVASRTCTDNWIPQLFPNECRETWGLSPMNLHYIYKQGSERIEWAQNGWEVYDHYFTIHTVRVFKSMHLQDVCNILQKKPASGVVTAVSSSEGSHYEGFFDDSTIVEISKLVDTVKIEHKRRLT